MVPVPHGALADVIRNLSAERSPACLIDAGGQFLFANDAFESTAAPAAAEALPLVGTSWLDRFAGEEQRRLHAELLFRALRPAPGGRPRPVVLVVEANTPTAAVLVQIRMAPVLLEGGPVAVAITHTAVRERPIDEVYPVVDRPPDSYRDAGGALALCDCCRRVRDPADPERWDLVPGLVERAPPDAAHVLCGLCRELHYGQPPAEAV
ncbi:MAG TPA: hypothetical protein VH880_07975 [Anaeromyxobacteraceae bacterium]|jgi:hypothetical protein